MATNIDTLALNPRELAREEQARKRALDVAQQQKRRHVAEAARGAAVVGATALGYGGLAREINDVGNLEDLPEGQRGANMAGASAQRLAQKTGFTSRQSSAVGGATAAVLQGENAKGVAQTALSWAVVSGAFSYLMAVFIEPIGAFLALCYLNLHYIMSKFGSKTFREMSFMQKFKLAIADVAFIFIVLLMGFLIYALVMALYCYNTAAISTVISLIAGKAPSCLNITPAQFSFGGGHFGGGGAGGSF